MIKVLDHLISQNIFTLIYLSIKTVKNSLSLIKVVYIVSNIFSQSFFIDWLVQEE